jgi:acetyl-CoA synthetase
MYWEDESGAAARTHSGICNSRRTVSRTRSLRSASQPGQGRADPAAASETAIAHIAVYQLGAIAVPLSFLFGPDALEYRLVDSEAKVAFVDPQSLPNFAPIRERCPGVAR